LVAVVLDGEVRLHELEAVGERVGGGELDVVVLLVLSGVLVASSIQAKRCRRKEERCVALDKGKGKQKNRGR
jgi:hypothetical protein